ncbi:unnamed protein product [Ixodes hexagonus]
MASGIHVDKAVDDVKECVKELHQEFQEHGTPINDDNTHLHRFCARLEAVLQHGQKDKVTLLGAVNNYWNYFCHCLASEKNLQGYAALKYAKSLKELKTSLGRGRAVVRYCLMHQCLAETLQVCSVNEKTTSDCYHDWALFRQAEEFQALISSLYDLNDVSFDLAPSGNDLDAAWPCFARKVFNSSWAPLSRSSSISSISSTVSQLDSTLPARSTHEGETAFQDDVQLVVPSLEHHSAGCSGDSKENAHAISGSQTRAKVLAKSRSLSPVVFKKTLPGNQSGEKILTSKDASPRELELKQRLLEAESAASTCAETLAKLKEHHLHQERAWKEREAQLQKQLSSLQAPQLALDTGVDKIESKQACSSSEHTKWEETVKRLTAEKEDLSLKNNFLSRKINEVLVKLEDTEESFFARRKAELELRTKVEKLNLVNEGLKNLVDALKEETVILRQQVLVMDKEVEDSHYLLEQKKSQCKCLEDQLVKVRSKCCETINASSLKDREIERLVSLVRLARRKLLARSPERSQPETSSKEQSPRISTDSSKECDETLLEKILSSGTSDVSSDDLSLVVQQYSTKAPSDNSNSELFEHCLRYLGSAMLHQESLIDRANSKVKDIVSTSHSINLQLNVLREVLSIKASDEESNPVNEGTSNHKETATPTEELVPPRIEGCDFVTALFETLCRNHSKLQGLMQTEYQLEKKLAECRELNRLLSGKVHEQERKLCGFVQELDRTKVLLAGMEDTRYKLQTAKAVMRYELQEKKHLLHNLKQQLESTREDCVRVMRSNAESELEWRSLREEFQSRKKQDSQDSGLSDNGHSTREQTPLSSEEVSEKDDPDSVEEDDRSDSMNVDEIPEGASSILNETLDMDVRYRARSQRLEYLEQQCQILYSSLVRSSERSNNLQLRLHNLLEGSNEATSRAVGADSSAPNIPVEDHISQGLEEEPDVLEDCDVVGDDVSVPFPPECEESSRGDESLPEIRKKTLDTIVHRVKLERSQSEELISSLRATIAELQSANERLRRQVLAQAEEKAQRENEMRQRASGMLRTERNLKCVQLKDITRERGHLLERNKELENKLEQKENELTQMDACRRKSLEKQKSLEKEVGTLTVKLDNQTTSHNHLYNNYVTQQTLIEQMKERIGDQEQMIGELERSVEELRENHVTEQTVFLKEVEKLQLALASRDEECSSLSDELKKLRVQADQDKEQGDHLKQQLEESSNIITSFEGQLKQLKEDSVDLKKKIVKLVKEKDVLWKQNDSLQFLQKLQATDKWMDNDEADSCLQCSAGFTFTLRKASICNRCYFFSLQHHCRLCGRIFCHNCSNNWLMTTASSRPTRVCNACAVQHDRLERAARNPSVSTTISVESEEEDLIGDVNTPKRSDAQESRSLTDCRQRQNTADSGIMSSSAPTNGGAVPKIGTPKIVRNWSFPKLRKLQFLQSSSSLDDGGHKQEFDIISDEEIARSLSACSPYNSSPSNSQQENTFHMSHTRTVEDIADCGPEGLQGEIWVNAGGTYGIPVLLKVPETALYWEFKCEPKSISFELKYKPLGDDLELGALEAILPSVRVQADVQPMEGHLVVREAGVYVLTFDNQHSKFIAKKVSYKLHLRKPSSSEIKPVQT